MIVRGLDSQGDWLFGKGKNDYKKDNEAIAQNIKTRLQSFLGDCFFDVGAGLDWFNLLGSKDQTALKLAVSATILNTSGVIKLIEISIDLSKTRVFSLQYEVQTIYSTIIGTVETQV